MISIILHLSLNAKKALVKGSAIGVFTLIAYVVIVIVTTPSLHPFLAIKAAFAMNSYYFWNDNWSRIAISHIKL